MDIDDKETNLTIEMMANLHIDDEKASQLPSQQPTQQHSKMENDMASDSIPKPKQPKERLMISKMELVNFKSYAGIQVIGPFHKCFTSIVGPNGSGKSNVIDALLFVLGFKANKIRQKRVSDLIHSSEKLQSLTFCQVNIHFQMIIDTGDGADDYEVIEGSQMVISRKATKSNVSTYYVNSKTVKQDEVIDILKSKGVDLNNNRFLILQGEVEQIAMMKPKGKDENDKGLLEFLEEIIGSDAFKPMITEAEQKVDTLNENKDMKLNRLKTMQGERRELEADFIQTVSYIKTKNELTHLQCQFFQLNKVLCKKELEIFEKELQENQDLQKETKVEVNKSEAELKELKDTRAAEIKDAKKVAKDVDKMKAEFAEFEKLDAQKRENVKFYDASGKDMKKQLQSLDKSVKQSTRKMREDEESSENLKNIIERAKENLVKEEVKLEELKDSLKDATAKETRELEKKEAEMEPWASKLREMQTEYNVAESEYKMIVEKEKKKREKAEEAENNKKQIAETIKNKKREIQVGYKNQKVIPQEIQTLKEKIGENEKELESMNQTLRTEKIKHEDSKNSLSAAKSKNEVLNRLMEQQKVGNIPGIFGRLGSLGVIEDKYDVAVTTACGSLNNVVVDTVETAQQCADFLRETKIGRATFLILSKMSESIIKGCQQKAKTPAGTKRLYDLIKPKDDRFRPAFYHALRDTLVCADLQTATRVSNEGPRRHRVVSLNGELVDASGAMSGGGTKVARGGMSSKFIDDSVTPASIEAHRQQIESYAIQLDELKKEITADKKDLGFKEEELEDLNMNVKKYEMDIEALTQQGIETEALAEELCKMTMSPEDVARKKELEKLSSQWKPELDSVQHKVDKLSENIEKLKKKILDIGGPSLKTQKFKVDSLNEELDRNTSALTKTTVSLKTHEKKIQSNNEKIEKLEIDYEKNQNELKEMRKEFDVLDAQANEVLQRLHTATSLHDEKQKMLEKNDKEYEYLQKKFSKLKDALIDIDNKVMNYKGKVKVIKENVEYWRQQHDELELIVIPEFALEEDDIIEQASFIIKEYNEEEIANFDKEDLEYKTTMMDEKVQQFSPNISVIVEYQNKTKEYDNRRTEHEEAVKLRDEARSELAQLKRDRLDLFMDGFNQITLKLKEMYQMITLGGDAELEQVNSLDPFEDGIVFSVRPPKKSWKNISNLSGGEKTLSSLALVFALHHFKPTPLYVMDEIDAALDFKNVSIVANYIKERTKNAQFVIISLRDNMFNLANRLVGIYKTDNQTKTVAINPNQVKFSTTAA